MAVRIYQPTTLQSPTWTTPGVFVTADRRTGRTPGTTKRDARSGVAVSMTGSTVTILTGTTSVLYTDRAAAYAVHALLCRRIPLQLEVTDVPDLGIGRFVTTDATIETTSPRSCTITFTWETI